MGNFIAAVHGISQTGKQNERCVSTTAIWLALVG